MPVCLELISMVFDPSAKVEVFTFFTLSGILGKIGGLYSMMTLLTNIALMYLTRKAYLKSLVK